MGGMHPILHKMPSWWLQTRAFALGDFVLMMRKCKVFAAEMQIEARPKDFHAHGAALDVPAGTALAPGARPEDLAVFGHTGFPEREICNRVFRVFIALHALAGAHRLKVQIHQLPIAASAF